MDRYMYRHKRVGEEREPSMRPPKSFRGSDQYDASVGQLGVQTQTFFKRVKNFCRGEERWANEGNRKVFGSFCLPSEDKATRCPDSVKEAKLPISSSVLPKFSEEVPTGQRTPCGPVKEVQQKVVKITAAHPPAAFEESGCGKLLEATFKGLTDELFSDVTKGETSSLALKVLGKIVREVEPEVEQTVVDQQTIPLLAVFTEKEEQQDVKGDRGVLEEADVVTEDTVEKLPYDVVMMKQVNVEAFGPVTKAKTPKSDPDHDSRTPSSTDTDTFRDLTEEEVVDYEIVDMEDTHKVIENTIPMKTISGFHGDSETSSIAAFEADCPNQVVPSEGPVVALKTTLLQENQGFLTEDPGKEQDIQRVWPDFLEGLSLF